MLVGFQGNAIDCGGKKDGNGTSAKETPRDPGMATNDDQNLDGFEEWDVTPKAVENEALLHQVANYLGDLYACCTRLGKSEDDCPRLL